MGRKLNRKYYEDKLKEMDLKEAVKTARDALKAYRDKLKPK